MKALCEKTGKNLKEIEEIYDAYNVCVKKFCFKKK